jgi:hypothetical protein
LLQTADVFITNMPTSYQAKLNILPKDTVRMNPRLIFAHMQAWGDGGPDEDKPGYDIGCFFAASGVAQLCQSPMKYNVYPLGYGDLATGVNLYSAIVAALLKQQTTGRGALVSTSLYAMGIWAAGPHMFGDTYDIGYGGTLLFTNDREVTATRDAAAKVIAALGPDPHKAASRLTQKALCRKLDAHSVSYAQEPNKPCDGIYASVDSLSDEARAIVSFPSVKDDLLWDAPCPFAFKGHEFLETRAPYLGEHQTLATTSHTTAVKTPLYRPPVTMVVEFGHSAALAFAGRLLASLGLFGDVRYVDTSPVWAQKYPGLTAHLRHGKRAIMAEEEAAQCENAVYISDRPREECGAPASALFVQLSGPPAADWYVQSGFSVIFRGSSPHSTLKQLPPYLVDACVGNGVAAAAVTQVFSQARGVPLGDGAVSYLRFGLYQNGLNAAMMQCSWIRELFCGAVDCTLEEAHTGITPTMVSFKTTGGVWLQFFAGNPSKDIPQLLKCLPYGFFKLGVRIPDALLVLVGKLVMRKHKARVLASIFEAFNAVIYGALAVMTYAEFESWANEAGWRHWAVVRSPEDARDNPHTKAIGCFKRDSGQDIGVSPLRVSPLITMLSRL